MNKKLIERLLASKADWDVPEGQPTPLEREAADALEAADKRIDANADHAHLANQNQARIAKSNEHLQAHIEQLEAEREGLFRAGHECAYHDVDACGCWADYLSEEGQSTRQGEEG